MPPPHHSPMYPLPSPMPGGEVAQTLAGSMAIEAYFDDVAQDIQGWLVVDNEASEGSAAQLYILHNRPQL